jgi:hypothetical protein
VGKEEKKVEVKPKDSAMKFLREMSSLTDDNHGRPLSARKWRSIDNNIDHTIANIFGKNESLRQKVNTISKRLDEGFEPYPVETPILQTPLKKK